MQQLEKKDFFARICRKSWRFVGSGYYRARVGQRYQRASLIIYVNMHIVINIHGREKGAKKGMSRGRLMYASYLCMYGTR